MSKRRFFKRAARKMLFSDWITEIFAFVVIGAFFVGVTHFGTSVAITLNELTKNLLFAGAVVNFFDLLALALVIPMIYGLFYFEINAVSNEKGVLSDLFYAFSDKTLLGRCYGLFLRIFIRGILCYLPAIALFWLRMFYFESNLFGILSIGNVDVISFVLNTVFVLLLYLGFVLLSGTFVGIFVTVKREDLSVDECFFVAGKCIRKNRFELAKLSLSFLPLFVISLFSIGFLFVIYTLPYMLITFVLYSKYFYEKLNLEAQAEIGLAVSQN